MIAPGCPSPWRDPRVIALLLLVFLCGSAAGALGVRYLHRSGGVRPEPALREGGREISVQRFKRELDLTEEQTKQFELILDDFMMYYQTLQAQMDEVRSNGKERLLGVLNPEQREKFGKMMGELQGRQIR